LKLTPDNVRDIIWKWGETIKKIINETWVAIDFKEDGTTIITAENSDIAKKAIEMINDIIWEPQIWEKILWKVIRVESFGVFVDLWRWKVGLCHISNLSKGYVQDTKKLFKEWEEIFVEVVNIKENGKIEIKNITDHNKL
jgi:polyribonucleotide nucleotidyltransferase